MCGSVVTTGQGSTWFLTVPNHEAQLLLRWSLDYGVPVGDDLYRQRYYQFAKDAAIRHLPPLPPLLVIEDIRTKRPMNFEIVDRSHREIFETSVVSKFI